MLRMTLNRTMTTVEEQLSRIATADKGRERKNVLVLGAGISGLVAAYELTRLGHKVEIFRRRP